MASTNTTQQSKTTNTAQQSKTTNATQANKTTNAAQQAATTNPAQQVAVSNYAQKSTTVPGSTQMSAAGVAATQAAAAAGNGNAQRYVQPATSGPTPTQQPSAASTASASTGSQTNIPLKVGAVGASGVPAMQTNMTPAQTDAWYDYYIRPTVDPASPDYQPTKTNDNIYQTGGGRKSSGGGGAAAPVYNTPTLPSATSQEAYIQSMYDANRQAQEDNLRAAYEANLGTLDYAAQKIPGTYNAAADQAAAQAAINRQNFNEYAAASGLNTGAGAQARLSQNNALAGNIASIRRAQADAEQELNFQRAQMETQYRNAIAEALAQNDLQKAQALYSEAKRVDESMVNTAANQANLDWTVWNALYNRR